MRIGSARAILLLSALAACRREAATPAAAKPAAKVENRQAEGALAVIELTAEAARRLGVETRKVERRAAPRARRYAGEVVVPAGRAITASAPFAAVVRSPAGAPRVGAIAAAGATLLTLEPQPSPDRQADLLLLKGQLDGEIAALAVERDADRIAADRAAAMVEAGSGGARARDEAQARLALTERRIETSKERRATLDALWRDPTGGAKGTLLVAPWRATVTALYAAEGQLVPAGAPLLELADLADLWLRVELPAADAPELDPAAAALVRPLGTSGELDDFEARPVDAAPRGDFARGTVERLFALAAASSSFQPGERASAALALRGAAERLAVPASALLRDVQGQSWVYVRLGERRFGRQRVEIDRVEGDLALLVRGPAEGAEVVAAGAAELFGTEFGAGK